MAFSSARQGKSDKVALTYASHSIESSLRFQLVGFNSIKGEHKQPGPLHQVNLSLMQKDKPPRSSMPRHCFPT